MPEHLGFAFLLSLVLGSEVAIPATTKAVQLSRNSDVSELLVGGTPSHIAPECFEPLLRQAEEWLAGSRS